METRGEKVTTFRNFVRIPYMLIWSGIHCVAGQTAFALLWWLNEWIRSNTSDPEDASTVALRSSLSEAIKLILSVIFYVRRRRILPSESGGARREVEEEEYPLNGVHELPERRRSGSFSAGNPSGNGNGWIHSPRPTLPTLRPWLSVSLVIIAALMLAASNYAVRSHFPSNRNKPVA